MTASDVIRTTPTTAHVAEPVAVTGATGKTGRRVLAHLNALGVPARPLSRRSAVPFRWEDERTWAPALTGATGVYLVVPDQLADPVSVVADLSARAAELGVRRQVLLSARGVEQPGLEEYAAMESAARAAGLATTVLRAAWFAQNFTEAMFLPAVLRGVLRLPAGDLRDPFVDAGDIAGVAAAALTSDELAGRTLEVTGPRVLSFRDAAAIIGEARGLPVAYEEVSPETYRDEFVADGNSEADAEVILAVLDLLRDGRSDHVSTDVQEVLGRPPRDFALYAADAAATGAWRMPETA